MSCTIEKDCNLIESSDATENCAQKWLDSASFSEILGSDSSHKSLFLLLSHPSGQRGILLANKSPFSEDEASIIELLKNSKLTEISRNDIFGSYNIAIPSPMNLLKAQLMFPVDDKLIAKYRQEEKYIIRETPEHYNNITKKYIEKHQLNMDWIINILEKRSEQDKIVFEDSDPHNGFVLMQDIKWDGKTIENLYLNALIYRRGIKSVRDLTGDDIPLLENIRDKSLETIKERYGLREDQVKCYFHYQPSYFHLHVHFINMKYDAPASSTISAILLDDVISNLKICSEFYKHATILFARKKSDKLLQMYVEAGIVKDI